MNFDRILTIGLVAVALVCAWFYIGKPANVEQLKSSVMDSVKVTPAKAGPATLPTASVKAPASNSRPFTPAQIINPNVPAPVVAPVNTPVATNVPDAKPLCTWQDGSQSNCDGTQIDAEHSQPGYCTPVQWEDGTMSCNDGRPSGTVDWPREQPTPWPTASPTTRTS